MKNTCIVIPCYNEEKRLPYKEIVGFIKKNEGISFCFSNDGSKDETLKLLKDIEKLFPEKVLVFDYKNNKGKAEVVRKSILQLLETKSYDFIGFFDADLATPLSEIKRFQNEFSRNPDLVMVMGSRFKRLGANIDRKFSRFFFGRIFATIISYAILKFPVYDTQCGAKLFSSKIPVSIFEKPFHTKWIFDVEILLRMKKDNNINIFKNILELPLKTWVEKGDSKIKFLDLLKVPLDILIVKVKY